MPIALRVTFRRILSPVYVFRQFGQIGLKFCDRVVTICTKNWNELPVGRGARTLGSVDEVPLVVIASDRRERGNLILHAAQRIEIAASLRHKCLRSSQ